MDAFTERQLLDTLKLISGSLIGIKAELADLNIAVRELGENISESISDSTLTEDEEDGEETKFDDPTVKFEVSDDSIEDDGEDEEDEVNEKTEDSTEEFEDDGKIHFKDESFE